MSEPLDRDTAQHQRHASRQVAEHARIMRDALREAMQDDHLADKLLMAWWQNMLATSNQPDIEAILKSILPSD